MLSSCIKKESGDFFLSIFCYKRIIHFDDFDRVFYFVHALIPYLFKISNLFVINIITSSIHFH